MYVRRRSRSPWRVIAAFFLTLAVIIIWAATLENGGPRLSGPTGATATSDVRPYFPTQPGMIWHYVGEGAEYAGFSRKVTAAQGSLVLVEDETTATTVGAVYSLSPERAAMLISMEEYSPDAVDLFEAVDGEAPLQRVPLQGPLTVGNSWQDQVGKREITARIPEVSVPAGTFYDVVVVKTKPAGESAGTEITEYYAVNVGLIKRDFTSLEGETPFTVSSFLHSYSYDPTAGQGSSQD